MPGLNLSNLRVPDDPKPEPLAPTDVDVTPQGDLSKKVVEIEYPDGSIKVYLGAAANDDEDDDDTWGANIASKLDDSELGRIADQLLDGILADNDSRKEWLDNRAEGIKLLGLKIESLRSEAGSGTDMVEGMSQIRHPLLLEAVIRNASNAFAELYPADGPVKVRNDDPNATTDEDDLADVLEKDMNHFLTAIDRDYVPDSDGMLVRIFLDGCAFKKVYHDPLKRRPCSLSISAEDIIVSNSAVSLQSAGRITHRFFMRPSIMKRMQLVGAYRDIPLGDPGYAEKSSIDSEIENVTGQTKNDAFDPRDRSYENYEVYCELDVKGFEHKTKGESDGLEVPYIVVIEKESRQVLSVRRNWEEGDALCMPKDYFVQFPFIRGFGFYAIGLSHMLGNMTNGLTAAWREFIDSGMFANFPGFLYAKTAGRQNSNEFHVPPGGGAPIETGGLPIQQAVMPLPYKSPDAVFVGFIDNVGQTGQRLGGTAEVTVGEGRQDAPVGTTLARIEQAAKPMMAVHKRLHTAQADEFQLLVARFREDPEAFWRFNKKPANAWTKEQFLQALDNYNLVPQADPNTYSHLQRVNRNAALYQLAKDNPPAFNQRAIYTTTLKGMGYSQPDQFLADAPAQPAPDPKVIAAQTAAQAQLIGAQAKAADVAQKGKLAVMDYQNQAQDHASDMQIEREKMQTAKIIHGSGLVADHVAQTRQMGADVGMHQAGLVSQGQQHAAGLAAENAQHFTGLASDHALADAQHEHEGEMQANAPKPAAAPGRKHGGRVNVAAKLAKAREIAPKSLFSTPRQAPDGNIYVRHQSTGVYHRVDGLG